MNAPPPGNARRRITRGIVPAAGLGTRLFPITRSQPKEMLPLGSKPTIQWVAEELVNAGITSVLFVTGENKRALEDHFDPAAGPFGDNSTPRACGEAFEDRSLRLLYTRQGGPRGLGDAILCGDTFADGENVVVSLGDVVVLEPEPGSLVRRLCQHHVERGAAATIAVNPVPQELVSRYGIVSPRDDASLTGCFDIADLVEKPAPDEAPSNLAITGRYVLSPVAFHYIRRLTPGHGGELQLTDALRAMLRDGLSMCAVPLAPGEAALDIGSIHGYWKAFMRVAFGDAAAGEEMRQFAAGLLAERS